jgi:hypothetical protein
MTITSSPVSPSKVLNVPNATSAQAKAQTAYDTTVRKINSLTIRINEAKDAEDFATALTFNKTRAQLEDKKAKALADLQQANANLFAAQQAKDAKKIQTVLDAMKKNGVSIQDVLASDEFQPVIQSMMDAVRASYQAQKNDRNYSITTRTKSTQEVLAHAQYLVNQGWTRARVMSLYPEHAQRIKAEVITKVWVIGNKENGETYTVGLGGKGGNAPEWAMEILMKHDRPIEHQVGN